MGGAVVAAVAVVVLAVFPVPASADHSPGQGGPNDFIAGSGIVQNAALGTAQLQVAAHSGPSGEDPVGRVHLVLDGLIGPVDARGSVQCLFVTHGTGNGFAELDEPLADGSRFLQFDVTDLGPPQQGESPDFFFWNFTSHPVGGGFGSCMREGRGLVGRTTGNFVVHGAGP